MHVCAILALLLTISSCILGYIVEEYEYFMFSNNTEYDLLLLFDYDTSDGVITLSNVNYCIFNVCSNNNMSISTSHKDSWDKHVKDSLHLYVLRDKIGVEYWSSHKKSSVDEFVEECLTKDYIEENLLSRMTLSLEDIYPSTDPPKEISFPPKDDSYYNTIYYNDCIKPTQ